MTDPRLSTPHGTAGQQPQARYILPSFIEHSSFGVKESNPYNKLFEERIIFLGGHPNLQKLDPLQIGQTAREHPNFAAPSPFRGVDPQHRVTNANEGDGVFRIRVGCVSERAQHLDRRGDREGEMIPQPVRFGIIVVRAQWLVPLPDHHGFEGKAK